MGTRSDRWLILAVLLLLAPSIYWANEPIESRFKKPVSPLDRTNLSEAEHWILVASARPYIPPNTTVMPVARERSREMSLFMFAVGLYPENRVEPSSYWNTPVEGSRPDYVVSFGCESRFDSELLVARVPYGCVLRIE